MYEIGSIFGTTISKFSREACPQTPLGPGESDLALIYVTCYSLLEA